MGEKRKTYIYIYIYITNIMGDRLVLVPRDIYIWIIYIYIYIYMFFPKDVACVVEGFCKYSVHVERKERREEIQGFGRIGDGVGRLLWCWLRQRRFLTVSLVGCFRKAIVSSIKKIKKR